MDIVELLKSRDHTIRLRNKMAREIEDIEFAPGSQVDTENDPLLKMASKLIVQLSERLEEIEDQLREIGTSNRRNPDNAIRKLEREYSQTADREVWLKLQIAKMRAGEPYERTFVIRTPHQPYQLEGKVHGVVWLQTDFNNGWYIQTWWDDTEAAYEDPDFDDEYFPPVGWVTSVYPNQLAGIVAIRCSNDDACARRCHANIVEACIDGSIGWPGAGDNVGDDPRPPNSPPTLVREQALPLDGCYCR